MNNKKIIIGASLLATGLSAGLFYGWSVSIIPALYKMGDKEFISALQAINSVIQNPLFFATFLGSTLLLPVAAYMYRKSPAGKLLIVSAGLYVVGVLGVTSAGNLPLSDKLDMVSANTLDSGQLAEARRDYEEPWNSWHTVRTFASVAAFAGVIGAVLVSKREEDR